MVHDQIMKPERYTLPPPVPSTVREPEWVWVWVWVSSRSSTVQRNRESWRGSAEALLYISMKHQAESK